MSYKKLKYLVKKLLKLEEISKDLDDLKFQGITNNIYRELITKLNYAKIIHSPIKGINYLKSDLLNKNYFFDNDKNISLISSIVHLEDNNQKQPILYYLFKAIPNRILFLINHNYSKNFNEKIIPLIDSKKFYFFKTLINKNSETFREIINIANSNKNIYEEIIPLELFIFKSSWYVCIYDVEKNEITIINSSDISGVIKTEKSFSLYISNKKINESIENFIKNDAKDNEYFFIKLKPELLSLFLEYKNIDNVYEVYEEKGFINFERAFVNGNKKKYEDKANEKIELFRVDVSTVDKYSFDTKHIYFQKSDDKKYIFKIKTSNIDFLIYLQKSLDFELLDISKYEIIE